MHHVLISEEMTKLDSFTKADIQCSLKKPNLISKKITQFPNSNFICVVGAFDLVIDSSSPWGYWL